MIVDAILRELYQNAASPPVEPSAIEVPPNLQQFFQDKSKKATTCGAKSSVSSGCGCS
jgi:hypothetical protein